MCPKALQMLYESVAQHVPRWGTGLSCFGPVLGADWEICPGWRIELRLGVSKKGGGKRSSPAAIRLQNYNLNALVLKSG
jgi:hypothetical protein